MTDNGTFRDDEWAITLALFRYGVIAELVEVSDRERGDVTSKVREIAARSHYLPGKGAIRVSPNTMRVWRMRNRGPIYIRIGGNRVKYRRRDLLAWIKSKEVRT